MSVKVLVSVSRESRICRSERDVELQLDVISVQMILEGIF